MKYESFIIGPNIYKLRKARNMTRDELSGKTGLSVSTIVQVETGGRNLSMKSLYLLMDALQCDANTILRIQQNDSHMSVDEELKKIPVEQRRVYREFFLKTINFFMTDKGG